MGYPVPIVIVISSGDNKHYIQISDEGKAKICVHLNGIICN